MHVPEDNIHEWVIKDGTIEVAKEWLTDLDITANPRHFLVLFVMYHDREVIFRTDDPDDQIMKRELTIFKELWDSQNARASDVERVLRFRCAWFDMDRRRTLQELEELLDHQAFSQ